MDDDFDTESGGGGGGGGGSGGAVQEVCKNCNSLSNIFYETTVGGMICESCGFVLEQSSLRQEVERIQSKSGDGIEKSGTYVDKSSQGKFPLSKSGHATTRGVAGGGSANSNGTAGAEVDHQTQAKHAAQRRLSTVASILHLPASITKQITSLLEKNIANAHGNKYGVGRWMELVIASCVYAIIRLNHKPITLIDVADAIQVNVYRLGHAFVRLVAEEHLQFTSLDPTLFVDRIVSKLSLTALPQKIAQIKSQCAELIKMAKKDWLITGRAPTAVAAAAVSLALAANRMEFDIKTASANLHIAERTIRLRERELLESIFKLGQTFPFISATMNGAGSVPALPPPPSPKGITPAPATAATATATATATNIAGRGNGALSARPSQLARAHARAGALSSPVGAPPSPAAALAAQKDRDRELRKHLPFLVENLSVILLLDPDINRTAKLPTVPAAAMMPPPSLVAKLTAPAPDSGAHLDRKHSIPAASALVPASPHQPSQSAAPTAASSSTPASLALSVILPTASAVQTFARAAASDPPSFRRAAEMRMARLSRIKKIVQGLKQTSTASTSSIVPFAIAAAAPAAVSPFPSSSPTPPAAPPPIVINTDGFDLSEIPDPIDSQLNTRAARDDAIISKLLLREGEFDMPADTMDEQMAIAMGKPIHDLNAPELTDDDLGGERAADYVRTDSELALWQRATKHVDRSRAAIAHAHGRARFPSASASATSSAAASPVASPTAIASSVAVEAATVPATAATAAATQIIGGSDAALLAPALPRRKRGRPTRVPAAAATAPRKALKTTQTATATVTAAASQSLKLPAAAPRAATGAGDGSDVDGDGDDDDDDEDDDDANDNDNAVPKPPTASSRANSDVDEPEPESDAGADDERDSNSHSAAAAAAAADVSPNDDDTAAAAGAADVDEDGYQIVRPL